MTNDVVVSVKGKLTNNGDEEKDTELVEIICPGHYYTRAGAAFVLYDQVEEGFDQSTSCVLKIRDGRVTLRKKGLVTTNFEFEPGVQHMTEYVTPFGSFILGITPRSIQIDEAEDELNICITYDMERNYTDLTLCEITINVKSVRQEENPQ